MSGIDEMRKKQNNTTVSKKPKQASSSGEAASVAPFKATGKSREQPQLAEKDLRKKRIEEATKLLA